MSDQLFKKLVAFTDIHFGLRGDSDQHNTDCTNFVTWFLEQSLEYGADTCIFLGDWSHNRSRISSKTMNVSLENIERLAKAFDNFYFITGNHDLYYRDTREINSMEFGRLIDNVTIISEPFLKGDVSIYPWLNGEEWKTIKKTKCKYMFGHFELPGFYMNQMVKMPDHGMLHNNDFKHAEYVFSGHFHKRQNQGKIHYIGNPFPHTYSDINDDDRGMMFLEWGGKPKYKRWPDAPNYRKLTLSELLEEPDKWVNDRSYVRVEMDVIPTFEEQVYIREEIMSEYNPRELHLIPLTDIDTTIEYDGEINFETVDTVVISHLDSIESVNIDNELLKTIYLSIDNET